MGDAFLAQLAASSAAVATLVGVAAWAKLCRPHKPLDDEQARLLFAQHFPGRRIEGLWIGVDGKAAVAKSGAAALVLCGVGEGFVARKLPWAQALYTGVRTGRLSIDLGDVPAPNVVIDIAAWPPEAPGKAAA